jgi:hypothetical protein
VHGKEKVLTTVRGETASHALYRAPLSTHGNGGTLCRAPRGPAHSKEWSRARLTMPSVVRHVARRTTKNGPGARWTMPFAVRRDARRTSKEGPGTRCTSPIAVHLVAWHTANNGQFVVRRPWRTTNLLLRQPFWVNLSCACLTVHGKLTQFFVFFYFSRPKIPKKHRHDIYITISITGIIYITTCIIYMSQYPSQASYIIISITNPHRSPKFIDKCTQKSTIHRQCT